MELLKIQQKNSIGIFISTAVLAIILLFFLAFPKFSEYNSLRSEASSGQAALQVVQNQEQQVQALFNKMQQSQTDLNDLNLAIPDKANIPDLYALIETQAKSASLNLTSVQAIDLSDPANKEKLQPNLPGPDGTSTAQKQAPLSPTLGEISVNLQLIGNLSGFTQFLTSIQQSMRLVDVQSVDIGTDLEKKAMVFNVVLKTYYQKQ